MNPRERVTTALNHQEPDRCPMQISFTPEFADRLKADMAMSGGGVESLTRRPQLARRRQHLRAGTRTRRGYAAGPVWLGQFVLNVLNPIQPMCMDPAALKRLYGDQLCFWGTIDEQETLPFGAPEQVRAEVMTRLKAIGKSDGLIIGPTHHVQLDTPTANFWAMVDTITGTPYAMLR